VVSHHDSLDSNQSQSSSRVPWRRFGWIHTDRVFGNSERWKLSGSVAVFDDVVFSLYGQRWTHKYLQKAADESVI